MPCEKEGVPCRIEGREAHGRVLEGRLAGDGVSESMNETPHSPGSAVHIRPVDRHEECSLSLSGHDAGTRDRFPLSRHQPHKVAFANVARPGIVGVDLDEGLRFIGAQRHRQASARHGVPLVAEAAAIQQERKTRVAGGRSRRGTDEFCLTGRCREHAIAEEACRARPIGFEGPLHRMQRIVFHVGNA